MSQQEKTSYIEVGLCIGPSRPIPSRPDKARLPITPELQTESRPETNRIGIGTVGIGRDRNRASVFFVVLSVFIPSLPVPTRLPSSPELQTDSRPVC